MIARANVAGSPPARPGRALAWARATVATLTLVASAAVPSQEVPTVRFTVERFEVEGENPLPGDRTGAILEPFTGAHEGLEGLLAAADALESAIRAAGFAFHRVSLPAQTLDGGLVKLRIIEFRVAKVRVTGNEHLGVDNVRRSLPGLREGAAPNTRRLARSIALANESPARKVTVTFAESKTDNALEARVKVRDRKPWSVYASLDNTGQPETGKFRASLGAQHANLWDRDHSLTLSYTTSPSKVDRVRQVGANYVVPLYGLASTASFYYTDSDVDSGVIADFFDVSGQGRVLGARLTHKLLRLGKLDSSVSVALEDKRFSNDVSFVGTPIGVDVRSRPLLFTWRGRYETAGNRFGFYATYARNVASGERNDDATYAAARTGANASWDAIRMGGTWDHFLPEGWLLRGAFDGQLGGEPLIAGEQFGIGGARSVRGFRERAASGDSGYRASAELWTPVLWRDVRLLGFAEGGMVRLEQPGAGVTNGTSVIGAGLGLRWQWQENASVTFDLARVVNDGAGADAGEMRGHFSVFVRY